MFHHIRCSFLPSLEKHSRNCEGKKLLHRNKVERGEVRFYSDAEAPATRSGQRKSITINSPIFRACRIRRNSSKMQFTSLLTTLFLFLLLLFFYFVLNFPPSRQSFFAQPRPSADFTRIRGERRKNFFQLNVGLCVLAEKTFSLSSLCVFDLDDFSFHTFDLFFTLVPLIH